MNDLSEERLRDFEDHLDTPVGLTIGEQRELIKAVRIARRERDHFADQVRVLDGAQVRAERAGEDVERLRASLRWTLAHGTFEVAEDNPLHGRALDEARHALNAVTSP